MIDIECSIAAKLFVEISAASTKNFFKVASCQSVDVRPMPNRTAINAVIQESFGLCLRAKSCAKV
jgi:hypothetical protein